MSREVRTWGIVGLPLLAMLRAWGNNVPSMVIVPRKYVLPVCVDIYVVMKPIATRLCIPASPVEI